MMATAACLAQEATGELSFQGPPAKLAAGAVATDWPGLLGPLHAPISPETHLVSTLPEKTRLVFEYAKGSGYAAPAVVGDRLILFHRVKNEEVVDCLHRETGRRFWRTAWPTAYVDRYGYTDGPRCAPAVDAASGTIIALGVEGTLCALDLEGGKIRWKVDLLERYKLTQNFFGVGASPAIEGDIVAVNVGARAACIVGFDLKSGRQRWAAPAPQDWGPSYAAAVPATVHGLRRLFVFAGGESRPATGGLICLDPASGQVDFTFPWRGKRYESVNASAPLVIQDKLFLSECYGKGGVLLKLAVQDGKLSAQPIWESLSLGTHFAVALPKDGCLYGPDGHGPSNCPIVCLDQATGKELWRTEPDLSETIPDRNGGQRKLDLNSDRCHLLHADGTTYCLTEWGHLLTLDLSPRGMKVTSRQWLFSAGETWSPPVLSRGLLYICQNSMDRVSGKGPRLVCIDLRRP